MKITNKELDEIENVAYLRSEEEFVDDEYIDNENDPEKVVIVPEDDYVIDDNEKVIEHEEILASPKIRSQSVIDRADYLQEEKVLEALRNGDFRKGEIIIDMDKHNSIIEEETQEKQKLIELVSEF